MAGFRRPDRWRIDMTEQEQLRQLKEEYENMTIPEAGRERLQAGMRSSFSLSFSNSSSLTEPGWRKKEQSGTEDVPRGLQ